jgi:hypothetical protein
VIGDAKFDHFSAECLLKMKQATNDLSFSEVVSNLSVESLSKSTPTKAGAIESTTDVSQLKACE